MAEYRKWVGPEGWYDVVGAAQFSVLTMLGLREKHSVLDIGCGSLRLGRFCILYLEPGNYCGIEPAEHILKEGVEENLGNEIVDRKQPSFDHNDQFDLGVFNRKFDFLVAQSIFSHASRSQIQRCLAQVARVLKPTGFFMFNWSKGKEDYKEEEWVYPGCVTYRVDTMESLVRGSGMSFQHKSFAPLKFKSDWTITSLSEENFERISHIPEQ